MISRLLVAACLMLTAGPAHAHGAETASETATATLADGSTMDGALRSISRSEVAVGNDGGARIPLAEVVRLDFHDRRRLTSARASLIEVINGDSIVAGLSSMSDEAVVALWKSYPDWPPVRIPSETIAGILMTVPEGALQRARSFSQVFLHREKTDVVLLFNGDRTAGDLNAFDQANLKLSQHGKALQIETGRVRGIAFNSQLSSLPPPKKPRVLVTLTDGSQLTGSSAVRESGGALRFATQFGGSLDVPLSAVATIRFLDGRAAYLSDFVASKSETAPFFSNPKSAAPARDRNAAGGILSIRGVEFPKGLGSRSFSRITFDLAGRYRRFQSWAGLDDLAEEKGSVRFRVEVDGVLAYRGAPVTGASPARFVGPIDVTAKRELVLIVEYGELADAGDWADWCDPLVIR